MVISVVACVFFFKQKTAYEMRISDWSSDVCSSDLRHRVARGGTEAEALIKSALRAARSAAGRRAACRGCKARPGAPSAARWHAPPAASPAICDRHRAAAADACRPAPRSRNRRGPGTRSEEHTSDLQSLMSHSYAVICLKKKN